MSTENNSQAQVVPDEIRVPVVKYLAVVTTPKEKASRASDLIRDNGKYSIFMVLNQGDGWVNILVWFDVRTRFDFHEHIKAVAGQVQLRYVELD